MTVTTAPLPHQLLRAATQASHDQVDAAFGGFDLARADRYAAFLQAHARVLPAIEAVLAGHPELPDFAPRTPALAADLATLGHAMPVPIAVAVPVSASEAWAMLYVVEGSRLGGVMLARQVPDTLPRAYLASGHARGGWRALLAGYDAAGAGWNDAGHQRAVAAARAVFDRYAESAALAEAPPG